MNTIEKELLEEIKSNCSDCKLVSIKNTASNCELIVEKYAVGYGNFISSHRLDFQSATDDRWIGLDLVYRTNAELFQLYIQSLEK